MGKVNGVAEDIVLKGQLLDFIHPIGSLYWSMVDTDPSELFGGTWEQIKGRFLLAAGENEANTTEDFGSMSVGELNRPAGELGGEAEHTLTADEMPIHNHNQRLEWDNETAYGVPGTGDGAHAIVDKNIRTSNAGGGQPHNNMPPYLTAYCWKRIA